jgi:uncharacterized membrane protein
MTKAVREVIISAIVMLILDGLYIYITHKAFSDQIINIQRVVMQVKYLGAVICYALLIGGLNYFIIQRNRSVVEAFFFGLVVYGVYDSTNYATLKKWTGELAIMDTIWGGSLMALTTYITYNLA